MEFRKILTLRGPNVWANFPVLEAWVDLGPYNDSCSSEIPGFNERIKSWLPSMVEHRCSIGERGGFFQRLDRGTYPAHILEHISIELQALCGSDVGFGRIVWAFVYGLRFDLSALVAINFPFILLSLLPRGQPNPIYERVLKGLFLALNIPFLAPEAQFLGAAERLRAQISGSPPITGFGEVLLPGDPELRARRHRLEEGIPIPQTTWDDIQALAAEWNVGI